MERIRAKAICVFGSKDRLFVIERMDPGTNEIYYVPLGGSIEFRETGRDCVLREVREEIGAEIRNVKFLGTIENLFQYNKTPHHEIVLIFEAEFTDKMERGRENPIHCPHARERSAASG